MSLVKTVHRVDVVVATRTSTVVCFPHACRSVGLVFLQVMVDPSGSNWTHSTIGAYGESKFDDQAGFERGLLEDDWGRLQVTLGSNIA